MPSPNVSSPSDSTRLRLSHLLSAIAILAFAFAFLLEYLSLALAVSVVGILTLEGLRVPRITDGVGMRRWLPWVFWSLMLAGCPVAIDVIGIVYEHNGPPAWNGPRPWAAQVIYILVYCPSRRLSRGRDISGVIGERRLPLVGLGGDLRD